MFPNVRLMAVAVVATLAALSFGFGVFAAFRVNHEPLARLQNGAEPLQMVAANPKPPLVTMPAATERSGPRVPFNAAAGLDHEASFSPLKVDLRDVVLPPSSRPLVPATASAPEPQQSAAPVAARPEAKTPPQTDEIPAEQAAAVAPPSEPASAPLLETTSAAPASMVPPPISQTVPSETAATNAATQSSADAAASATPNAAPDAAAVHPPAPETAPVEPASSAAPVTPPAVPDATPSETATAAPEQAAAPAADSNSQAAATEEQPVSTPAAAVAPHTAALAAQPDVAPSSEQKPAAETAKEASTPPKVHHRTVRRKPDRPRAVVKIVVPRPHKPRLAAARGQPVDQASTYLQPHFESAPPAQQVAPTRAVRVRSSARASSAGGRLAIPQTY